MGHKLSTQQFSTGTRALIPWLDRETDVLIQDMVETLSERRPDLLAVILYGSVAHREQRPLDDEEPSDVDLLAVFDTSDELFYVHQGREVIGNLGLARERHLDAPREVQVMFASRTLGEWDPAFVENVARDGLLLFARGPLPVPLGGVRPIAAPSRRAY